VREIGILHFNGGTRFYADWQEKKTSIIRGFNSFNVEEKEQISLIVFELLS